MAAYVELNNIASGGAGDALKVRIKVAIIIAAEAIRSELDTVNNHANRLTWAAQAFANPEAIATKMLWALLAQNATATVIAITGATDEMIQANVNNAVDVFATG